MLMGLIACLAACQAESPASYEQAAEPSVEDQVRAYLQADFEESWRPRDQATFHLATADVNGDGVEEAFVWNDYICGTSGCPLLVLQRDGAGWKIVADVSITWPPIRLLESSSNGWRDLAVKVAGGGIIPGYEAVLSFDGRSYPENPTVPPARPSDGSAPGRVLISGDHPLPLFPEG